MVLPVVFIAALTVGIAGCGQKTEAPVAQTAQATQASGSSVDATDTGTSTNFEGKPFEAKPAPPQASAPPGK
jgi:hypothetical protein